LSEGAIAPNHMPFDAGVEMATDVLTASVVPTVTASADLPMDAPAVSRAPVAPVSRRSRVLKPKKLYSP